MDYVSSVCCLLAFLLYYNTLDAGFVYDDRRAILSNPDLLPKTPWSRLLENDFWGTPLSDSGSHGSYRPLCVLTFRLNYLLGGFQPWGYHLVNVLLHCLATALLVKVARQLFTKSKSTVASAVTGLLFATHPVHTEAVAGIVGRADLAACNLYLLSLLSYIAHVKSRDLSCCHRSVSNDYDRQQRPMKYQKYVYNIQKGIQGWSKQIMAQVPCKSQVEEKIRNSCCFRNVIKMWIYLVLCVLLSIAAMLSKETGITVLGVCCVYDLVYSHSSKKKQWRSLVILGVAGFLLLMLRLQTRTPDFSTADNPTAREPKFITRFLTFSYLPAFNFWLLILPNTLSFDWGMDAIPRIGTLNDVRNVLTLFFYTGFVIVLRKSISNILKGRLIETRIRTKVSKLKDMCEEERFKLYWCKICYIAVPDYHTLSCRNTNNNNCVNSHASCVCSRSHKRVALHRDKRSLGSSNVMILSLAFLALPFLPATNLLFYVGFVVAERVLYLPSAGLCLLLGLAGATLWNHRKYRTICTICFLVVLISFSAKTVLRNGDWLNEETLYRSAIPVNPPKAYGNLGSVLSSQGRTEEAEAAFTKALQYRPNMADVHYNLVCPKLVLNVLLYPLI